MPVITIGQDCTFCRVFGTVSDSQLNKAHHQFCHCNNLCTMPHHIYLPSPAWYSGHERAAEDSKGSSVQPCIGCGARQGPHRCTSRAASWSSRKPLSGRERASSGSATRRHSHCSSSRRRRSIRSGRLLTPASARRGGGSRPSIAFGPSSSRSCIKVCEPLGAPLHVKLTSQLARLLALIFVGARRGRRCKALTAVCPSASYGCKSPASSSCKH